MFFGKFKTHPELVEGFLSLPKDGYPLMFPLIGGRPMHRLLNSKKMLHSVILSDSEEAYDNCVNKAG